MLELLQRYEEFALLISLIISILIALSGILPSVFVTAANIIFFGPIQGFLISLLGETIGGYISFIVYRKGIKGYAENLSGKYKLVDKITKGKGIKGGILVVQGRLIPFVPSGFVTMAAAISNLDAITFTIATLIGKIPSIGLECIVSYDIININENGIRLLITLVGIVIGYFLIRKYDEN